MSDDGRRQTIEQRRRAVEPCHCGHLREVHDPCSTCECRFFRPAERVRAKTYRIRPVPAEGD